MRKYISTFIKNHFKTDHYLIATQVIFEGIRINWREKRRKVLETDSVKFWKTTLSDPFL